MDMREAAKRLGIGYSTIRRWIGRGDLDTAKVGHRVKVSAASVDAILKPSGARRTAARILTDEEVEQQLRWMADQIAKARAGAADAG